jgi:hypothetical protein
MSKKQSFSDLKAKAKARRRNIRMALFGSTTPSPVRDELVARFGRLIEEFKANDAADLLAFLQQMRRGYSLEHDGPASAMQFIDDWRRAMSS